MHSSIYRFVAAFGSLITIHSVAAAPTLAINMNWPDPSILLVDGIWYSYATADRGLHVQVASADNLEGPWDILPDAMPKLPSWVVPDNPTGSFVEAPDVVQLVDNL
jgi:arabinan endo-1,5-alpha-L-arabinosidase